MNTPKPKQTPDYMLDTVALKIKYPDFKVTNPSLFSPKFDIVYLMGVNLSMSRNRYWKYVQNPPKNNDYEMRKLPRLTGYMRLNDTGNRNFDLIIEFSIPKLLWGQSLQELSDSDFETIVSILTFELRKMGVELSDQAIRNAIVVRAHFGKNIPLPSPVTAQDALAELYKADIGRGKHINMRHYENGGQALYYYASSCNIIFYDKLRDIATPKNKAVDKDKFKQEKLLVDSSDNKPELLRFEVRFGKQQSLDTALSEVLGKKIKGMLFKDIFNSDLSKRILLKSWADIVSGPASQLALKMDQPLEEVFDAIIRSYIVAGKKKAHSLNKALRDVAIYILINRCGARKIRDKIEKNWTGKSWARLYAKMKDTAEHLKGLPPSHTISDIQTALDKFEKYDWQP
jgi:hypothetical protein